MFGDEDTEMQLSQCHGANREFAFERSDVGGDDDTRIED
jgi:hypothetical protein